MSDSGNDRNFRDNQGGKKPGNGSGGPGGLGKNPRGMYSWLVFLLIGLMLLFMLRDMSPKSAAIGMDEFIQRVENGEVLEVQISDTVLTGKMRPEAMVGKEPDTERFTVVLGPGAGNEQWFMEMLDKSEVEWEYQNPNPYFETFKGMIPILLIFGLLYFFLIRQFKGAGGAGMLGNFGRSRHRISNKEQAKVTFEHVAGIEEAKEELEEIIHFLRNPKKFQRLGGRIPRGVLLIGEPGCGKTLLAKAIAGEANVPFFSISGSDFVEMFVGVGASRVRDLFKQAKDNSPCIIFLDEIDAVGRKRGASMAGGGHDEREQTLNAILVEMDGFGTDDQVIVIAATNRADILDHALTRPGRFDRQIYVPLPDIKGRFEILKVHAKKIKQGPDIDLHRLARGTSMFSGADLEAIINEAALAATMEEKEYVEMCDLEEARDKVRWGRARRSRVIDEKDRVLIAYHEAGHALAQSLLEDTDPVHKVSIISRGSAGGATFSLPEKDHILYTRKFCLSLIRVCFGGQLAEDIFYGDISSGAQMDIRQATGIARQMVTEWGMSEKLGFVNYGPDEKTGWENPFGGRDYSDQTAEVIDSEIKAIMDAASKEVRQLLESHREQMESIKEALLKYETVDGEEIKLLLEGKSLDRPTVADLLEAEQQAQKDDQAEKPVKVQPGTLADDGLAGPMPQPGIG